MKKAINTQAQNEVKELLNEYVVSPLNEDITGTLTRIEREIESLKTITESELKKISPAVNGSISRLQKREEERFGELSEAINDSNDMFSEKIEDVQEVIDANNDSLSEKIVSVQREQANILSQINEALTRLLSELSKEQDIIDYWIKNSKNELETTADERFDRMYVISKEGFAAQKSSLKSGLHKLSEQLLEQSKKDHDEYIDKLCDLKKQSETKLDGLSKQSDEAYQNVSNTLKEQETLLSSYYEKIDTIIQNATSQQKEITEQKYKRLFAISLSCGIVNTIGVIIIILLYLLR